MLEADVHPTTHVCNDATRVVTPQVPGRLALNRCYPLRDAHDEASGVSVSENMS